jgi:hypothetical protein
MVEKYVDAMRRSDVDAMCALSTDAITKDDIRQVALPLRAQWDAATDGTWDTDIQFYPADDGDQEAVLSYQGHPFGYVSVLDQGARAYAKWKGGAPFPETLFGPSEAERGPYAASLPYQTAIWSSADNKKYQE